MVLNTSLHRPTGHTATVKPKQLSKMPSLPLRSPTTSTVLNIRNTPPLGHSFSSAQSLMGRRTLSTLPLSAELLKPEPPDPWTVCSEITCRKEASKPQYDKHARSSLLPVPLGSHVYAKPRPSQRGTPWIYGQVVDNPSPSSYSVDTGDFVLRRNRTQLQPAAPPQNNLQQPPALPIPQPSPLGTPTILSDLSQRKLSQPPCHSPSSGMSALSAPSQCRSNRRSKQMQSLPMPSCQPQPCFKLPHQEG